MPQVKCRFCKQSIDKESAYNPAPRIFYCNEEHYQKQLDKDKYKPKPIKANGETNQRRLLTDWLMEQHIEQGYDKHDINELENR